MKRRTRSALTGLSFGGLGLAGFLAFFLVPFLISIVLSFSSSSSSFQFVGLDNYAALFRSQSFRLALWNTLRFIAAGVPLLMICSLGLALTFHYLEQFRDRRTAPLFAASLIPMVVPSSAVVLFVEVLFEKYGAVNGILVQLGWEPVNWMNSGYAAIILLGLYLWKNVSYNTVILLGAMGSVRPEVYEAAALDGAGFWRSIRYIALPQIRPFLSFTVLLSLMGIFKMYRESYLLFGDYPDESVYLLQNYMNNHFYAVNYQRLSTASAIFFLLVGLGIVLGARERYRKG